MSLIGIILGAFLLFYLQDRLYCRLWDKDLSVSLEFSGKSAVEGEECELCERVENRKPCRIRSISPLSRRRDFLYFLILYT